MVKKQEQLSVRRQCELLGLSRSRFYYQAKPNPGEAELSKKISEIYEKHPVYGYRRIKNMLNREDININGKKVLRIMRSLGLKAIYPGPNTSKRNLAEQVSPIC